MNKISNVLLIVNSEKCTDTSYVSVLSEYLVSRGCNVELRASREDFGKIRNADMAVVLGGDGSIIGAAAQLAPLGIPMLGINFGRLGYLAELESTDIELLDGVLYGEYFIEERMMLDTLIIRKNEEVLRMPPALNDIVLSNGPVARLMTFDVSLDGIVIEKCRADGMIAATPTGSTAYSMSAGGPILSPVLDAFCLTPICPHSLNNRPIIVPGSSLIGLSGLCTSENSVYITVDGHRAEKLCDGDSVRISCSPSRVRLVRLKNNSFLETLRAKLQ